MAKQKILILGFSVTAETPGFFDRAKDKIERKYGVDVYRASFGGMQPHHARYIFPSVIRSLNPNIVILDHSTPGFRNLNPDQDEYKRSFLSLMRTCQVNKIKLSVVDLPRTDVDYANDWVSDFNRRMCKKSGTAYRLVPTIENSLRDEVHATGYGNLYYSRVFLESLPDAEVPNLDHAHYDGVPLYDCIRVESMMEGKSGYVVERGGYRTNLAILPDDGELNIDLGGKYNIRGFTSLMGPKTGHIEICYGGNTSTILSHDKFCYYNRLGAFLFKKSLQAEQITNMSFRQLPEIPDTIPLKGEKDFSKRIGAIGHILFEHPRQDAAHFCL